MQWVRSFRERYDAGQWQPGTQVAQGPKLLSREYWEQNKVSGAQPVEVAKAGALGPNAKVATIGADGKVTQAAGDNAKVARAGDNAKVGEQPRPRSEPSPQPEQRASEYVKKRAKSTNPFSHAYDFRRVRRLPKNPTW